MTPPRSTPHSPSTARRWLLWTGGVLVALSYLALSAFHIAYGAMNVDEGFYAAATRAVWQGEMPYRDFGFTQMPLVPYANAPGLALLGFGLFEQRALNALWGALALLLAARLVLRRAGPGWAVLLVALFAVSPAWLYFISLGKTYGLTALLAIAMTTVYLDVSPGWKRAIALSFLGVLGVAARLPAAPFFGLLWLLALIENSPTRGRDTVVAVASLLGFAAAMLLPFYLSAPEQSVFWTAEFHRVSVPNKTWRLRWDQVVGLAPTLWVLAAVALGWAVIAKRAWKSRAFGLLAATLITLATNLLPQGVYEEYGVPFLPPLGIAAAILLAPLVASWPRPRVAWTSTLLVVAPVGVLPAMSWSHLEPEQKQSPSFWLPTNTRPYNFELATNLRAATAAVEKLVPADQPFIGSAIILAVEANRAIPRTLRMGAFTMTFDYDTETANRLHLETYDAFARRLRDIDLPMLGFHSQGVFNYMWSVPSFRFQSKEEFSEWGRLVERYFVPVHQSADFAILARPHVIPLIRP